MKYRVTIEGREREIDVVLAPDGGVSVSLDGAAVDANVERVPGGVLLRIGDRVFDVAVGGPADAMQVGAGAARALAQVVSERARARAKRGASTGGGAKELRAPMPGRVVKVLVAPGDPVEPGTPCVVIEAMKMENELRASGTGKVAAVHVSEGASVEGKALLVSFE
ncbi:MAG TPA: biotin/lipoyl-containing protein [Sandaracinaceae bacterium]